MRSFRVEKYQEIPQVNTTFTQTACLNPILSVPGCGNCCTNGGTTLNLGANQVATFAPNIPVSSVLTLQFKIQWPASANMSLRTVTYSTANGQTPIPVANFTKGDEYAFVTISNDIAPINLAIQFGVAGAVLKDISYSTTSGTYLVNDKMKDLLPEIICNQEDKTGKYFYTSTTSTCSLTELNGNLVITPTSGNQESLARWYNGLEVGKTYTFVARVPIGKHFSNARPVIRVTDYNGRGITLQANTGLMPFNNGNHTVAQASRHPDGNEWVYWLRFPATTTSVKLEYLGAIQGVNEGQILTSLQLLQTLPEVEYGGGSDYRYGFNGKEKENTLYNSSNAYDFGARLYDSRLGRWFGVDALAEKFSSTSPYCFVLNSPFIYLDPDGRDIKVASEVIGGKTIITITVTGKLINESSTSYTQEQLQSYTDRLVSAISSSFTGSNGDISWKGVANITVATNGNELSSTDHAFRIVDKDIIPDGEGGFYPEGTLGAAVPGENMIYLSQHILDRAQATSGVFTGSGKTTSGTGTLERTGPHELGHSASLPHPTSGTMDGNLMHQTSEPNACTELLLSQILGIKKEYDKGKLNEGKQKIE